ncbi:hypothetical protein Y032_1289g3808 [Ancylostoma ceylanicum]|uniref:Uncharacterized protein n=1 Tax=Ancylostoma ceylanicum TaxID=53326 RepID=A0A016W5L5_9BILA|nr:hypothetical protein Y032_1289g3808 [Ancylostoma ceylanicum]
MFRGPYHVHILSQRIRYHTYKSGMSSGQRKSHGCRSPHVYISELILLKHSYTTETPQTLEISVLLVQVTFLGSHCARLFRTSCQFFAPSYCQLGLVTWTEHDSLPVLC